MSVYKRGDVWWYKFRFANQVIRETSKSESKTIAKEAERARRRQLEEGYNRIARREKAQLFSTASRRWLDSRLAHVAPKTVALYKLAIDHLKKYFGALLCLTYQQRTSLVIRGSAGMQGLPGARSIWKSAYCAP